MFYEKCIFDEYKSIKEINFFELRLLIVVYS